MKEEDIKKIAVWKKVKDKQNSFCIKFFFIFSKNHYNISYLKELHNP